MATIRANCRESFSAEDFAFIAESLAGRETAAADLTALLRDPDALDTALESDRLFRSLLELPRNVPVSPQLYFYVLVRHMLARFDRTVADYVANVLATFVDARRVRAMPDQPDLNLGYISDMLIALKSASSEREFLIRVHVGNYSLFLAGVFPQHIQHRAARHGAPEIGFYEEVGSQNYRLASDHRLAREHALVETYRTIADRFSEVRVGLNQLTDRLICLETPRSPLS